VSLGRKIADLRKKRGWTQDLLAEKVGVHKNHVTRWETDRMRPSIKTMRRLADLLGVSLDHLLDDNDVPEPVATPTVTTVDDPVLAEKVRKLQELNPDDLAIVYRLIDTLSTQKQMERLLSLHRLNASSQAAS
jgi:transcriptional regulator with XRE-family HTH domain